MASTASNRIDAKIQNDISRLNQHFYLFKHQNKVKFKTLGDSELLRGDFTGHEISGTPLTSLASATWLASTTSTVLFQHRTSWSWWFWIIPWTKTTNTCPFLWNGSSKIQFFTDIWHPFYGRLLRPVDVTFLKTGW